MIKRRYKPRATNHKPRIKLGSALILTVVLTSLLAIIGVMFIMMARVDKMATSAISENKELNFAVETVVALVSQELVLDVPGMPKGGDYYDYPDACNPWLANLEPYQDGNDYNWRRISDIYSRLDANDLLAIIVPDYQKPSEVGDSNSTDSYPADADGDGVADSKWVKLADMTSNKGKPIYAAIRIIDNGGMINVNTVFANPGGSDERKGDMLTDIYIDGLVKSGTDLITTFLDNRSNASDANTYYTEAARRIENPDTTTNYYTFYDISEELSLRNRYLLYPGDLLMTRLESPGPPRCLTTTLRASIYGNAFAPYTSSDFGSWKRRLDPFDVGAYGSEPNSNNYDFRHLLTTYNMDRIIRPNGEKMVNINRVDEPNYLADVNQAIHDSGIDNAAAAQIAVNLKDYIDSDSNVAFFVDANGVAYYGFESPCVYISELAHRFQRDVTDPNVVYRSYAVELYKPYSADNDPNGWQLVIDGSTTIAINNWTGNKQFYVIQDQDSNALLDVDSGAAVQDASFAFTVNTKIELQRPLPGGGYVTVDWYKVDPCIPSPPWLSEDGSPHSVQRDIQLHKCIRRLWASVARNDDDELGKENTFVDSDPNVIQAHPANTAFTNIGEIGMLFRKDVYSDIVRGAVESDVRLNLADPNFQQLFKYLTVFDPSKDGINNDGDRRADDSEIIDEDALSETPEWKVPGRININTAPWYVIAQLPWVSQRKGGYNNTALAQAIIAYRDKTSISGGPNYSNRPGAAGFRSIGELNNVVNGSNDYRIDYYDQHDSNIPTNDLPGFPDLTGGDGAPDDFEERDVIFARISNLVTVRSDVFTAYILVRIGTDGPQKRAIAILDRSNVYLPTDKVRIIALHPVPDPR